MASTFPELDDYFNPNKQQGANNKASREAATGSAQSAAPAVPAQNQPAAQWNQYTSANPAAAQPARANMGGVAGSNFVNFDRQYAANKGVSDRIAQEQAARVRAAGQKAQTSQDDLWAGFQAGTRGRVDNQVQGHSAAISALQNRPTSGGPVFAGQAEIDAVHNPYTTLGGPQSLSEYSNPYAVGGGYSDVVENNRLAGEAVDSVNSPEMLQATLSSLYGLDPSSGSTADAALVGYSGAPEFSSLAQRFNVDALGQRLGGLEKQGDVFMESERNRLLNRTGERLGRFEADEKYRLGGIDPTTDRSAFGRESLKLAPELVNVLTPDDRKALASGNTNAKTLAAKYGVKNAYITGDTAQERKINEYNAAKARDSVKSARDAGITLDEQQRLRDEDAKRRQLGYATDAGWDPWQ